MPASATPSEPRSLRPGQKPFPLARRYSTSDRVPVNRARGYSRRPVSRPTQSRRHRRWSQRSASGSQGVPIERNTVEASEFFNRTFSGVLAWGLLFLLDPAAQALVIEKVARALNPGGRFLFTSPKEPVEWLDGMTDRPSQSLGAQTYERLLREAGLTWVADAQDEGENHYYFVEKL